MKTLIIKKIPDDLHKAFKMACLKNDTDMRAVVVELMREYAEREGGDGR